MENFHESRVVLVGVKSLAKKRLNSLLNNCAVFVIVVVVILHDEEYKEIQNKVKRKYV